MPLDGHSYLASYGWSGKGTGLRRGAIDKPLAIPPKRNLSGVGKDRDEAFPFWDHLYSAATKAITIKISDDDDDGDNDDEDKNEDTLTTLQLKRTATGIISNRRPISGTPASGSSTPCSDAYPRASVIAIAKREAARKGLYSRFFRGPILAPDDTSNLPPLASSPMRSANHTPDRQIMPPIDAPSTQDSTSSQLLETREERRERKRLKRERREKKAIKKAAKTANQKTSLHNLGSKDDRRARKEAKRAQKASTKKPPDGELQKPGVSDIETNKRNKRKRDS